MQFYSLNQIKKENSIIFLIVCLTFILFSGCQDILDEQPRSKLVPSFFETADGVRGALNSAYSDMRSYYGSEGGMASAIIGTDLYEGAALATSDAVALDDYTGTLNPNNGIIGPLWSNPFKVINTSNGVIQFANENQNLSPDEKNRIISEAKYLRALNYFLLVRTFGGVPLDIGAGELEFNTEPATGSTRNSVAEVYDAIIQDLQEAIDVLPNEALQTGRADKAAAMHLLSKVYLTRGWSESASQPDDFSNAYDLAKELIDNSNSYGLQLEQYYSDVNAPGNEHGSESIWTSERTKNRAFSGGSYFLDDGSNRWNLFFQPYYYTQTVSYNGETVTPVTFDLVYNLGWVRFKPTNWFLENIVPYSDRGNDSRFDSNFRMVWYCNTDAGAPVFSVGDTALYLPGYEVTQAEKSNKKYRIWTPSEYDGEMYPQLTIYDDPNREGIFDASTRSIIVFRFSETYLIAAEAALKDGRPTDAVPYLNAIRERAAYRKDNTPAQNFSAAAAMTISAGDVDIDFILDERARELVGMGLRWFDLVRTNKLIERVQLANAAAAPNIQSHHKLRPIPQKQIDLMTGSDNNSYQNPGY